MGIEFAVDDDHKALKRMTDDQRSLVGMLCIEEDGYNRNAELYVPRHMGAPVLPK